MHCILRGKKIISPRNTLVDKETLVNLWSAIPCNVIIACLVLPRWPNPNYITCRVIWNIYYTSSLFFCCMVMGFFGPMIKNLVLWFSIYSVLWIRCTDPAHCKVFIYSVVRFWSNGLDSLTNQNFWRPEPFLKDQICHFWWPRL